MKPIGWMISAAFVLWALAASATTNGYPPLLTGRIQSATGMQVAMQGLATDETSGYRRRGQHANPDADSDEYVAPQPSRQSMPGRKPGVNVTAPPGGYDAKHISRLWGRFTGAKTNTKADKATKANANEDGARPSK